MESANNTTDDETHSHSPDGMRLQKYLAAGGFGSRRHAEQYIQEGRVTVDGQVVDELGVRIDPRRQEVRVDGEVVKPRPKRYYLLNKPSGFLCTTRDPGGRPRAIDLVPDDEDQLFTVGRLDENTEGLVIVTNDGELSNRLAHPRFQVPRCYRVQVAGRPSQETLGKLRRGIFFAEGKFRVRSIRRTTSKGKSTFLELVLTEGRNREIRRMFARAGHKVMHLERIAFGPVNLGRLPVGRYRRLRPNELKALRELIEGTESRQKPARRRGKASRKSK